MARPKGSKNKDYDQFCVHGHDINIVGRTNDGRCKKCVRNRWHRYYNRNKNKIVANSIVHQTNRNLRIVAWTDWDNINSIYKKCPKNKTVDHYIPLQGDLVSGLHVSWNLQYLTDSDNYGKNNAVDLIEVSDWYSKILTREGLR